MKQKIPDSRVPLANDDGTMTRDWFKRLERPEYEQDETPVAASAGAAVLPAAPIGFLTIKLNGELVKIPYYGV